MGTIKAFEDIEAWQTARILTRLIYSLTNRRQFSRDFGLADQIRRAAVSIMSNIAEGFESQTDRTFIRFLGFAKGSAGEFRSQLYVALDQEYVTKAEFESLLDLVKKISCQVSRLKQYLESPNKNNS
jgi:four helix bundle protein